MTLHIVHVQMKIEVSMLPSLHERLLVTGVPAQQDKSLYMCVLISSDALHRWSGKRCKTIKNFCLLLNFTGVHLLSSLHIVWLGCTTVLPWLPWLFLSTEALSCHFSGMCVASDFACSVHSWLHCCLTSISLFQCATFLPRELRSEMNHVFFI